MVDLELIAKVLGSLMAIFAFLLYIAKVHRDLFIAPWFRKELGPIKSEVTIVARMLREKYREEYEQAEEDILRENKLKGVA